MALSDNMKNYVHFLSSLVLIFCLSILIIPQLAAQDFRRIRIHSKDITLLIGVGKKLAISSMVIHEIPVITSQEGIYSSVKVDGNTYSTLNLEQIPQIQETKDRVVISNIAYGSDSFTINESWTFTKTGTSIAWTISRSSSKSITIQDGGLPVFNFDGIDTWNGAYQGYGGLAWFYLFNEKLCTYGVHSNTSHFWNSKNRIGLSVSVKAPAKEVAMKYTRTLDDKLAFSVAVSSQELQPAQDTGTYRRRFIRGNTDVWAPFKIDKNSSTTETITLDYFDYEEKYGRGNLAGLNQQQVSDILGTIARIGVIDAKLFGGNSWHTPYGPICLHEQYIAQLGLGINDPEYLAGYKDALNNYRDHAIKADGRVFSRWAYTNEDAAPGAYNKEGFYEAQWGTLIDANPDFVTNVAELYELTGDKNWVKTHQLSCEKALTWLLSKDSNANGLVEMINKNTAEKKSSDWIDIIWASWENAFISAKLYLALTKWAQVERELKNMKMAAYYENFAAKLKESFNNPTSQGGFWDEEKGCYIHWIDEDKSIHGSNMVTPINFMAISYGICDDPKRKKLILDNIETQMKQEKLFFWPICMTSYAPTEGAKSQYPFPKYENGDLFLSWGAVAVDAYAGYKPEIALKYIKNVLNQYEKDGLAYQRYGRKKQDGLGDDILSGNALIVVGLYKSIYGINPCAKRLYLNPKLTPELAGTLLNYNFRNEKLKISLSPGEYSISNEKFTIKSKDDFGYFTSENQLQYFKGSNNKAAISIRSKSNLILNVSDCTDSKMELTLESLPENAAPISIELSQLLPNTLYTLKTNGKVSYQLRSSKSGSLKFSTLLKGKQSVVIDRS